MKKISLVLWFVSAISLVCFGAIRFILGGWLNLLYIPLLVCVLSIVGAVVLNFRFYYEVLSFKSAKNSLNIGSAIFISLACLFFVNFLVVRYDNSFDLTSEKLNSLSKQTVKVLEQTDKDFKFMVFYSPEQADQKAEFENLLALYKVAYGGISIFYHDVYKQPGLSKDYLKPSDKGMVVFLETGKGKSRVKVSAPYTESTLTSALIKVTRDATFKVAFAQGHGEFAFSDTGHLSSLSEELKSLSYQVSSFNLAQGESFPMDADIVAYVGTRSNIFDSEFEAIKKYLAQGGRLLLALEPKRPVSKLLAQLVGVNFSLNYVVNDYLKAQGRGRSGVLGVLFDKLHPITADLSQSRNFIFMEEASSVSALSKEYEVVELVKAAPQSILVSNLNEKKQPSDKLYALAAASKKVNAKNPTAVVFADSTFFKNELFAAALNKDIILNSFSFLSGQDDLVNISPKQVSKTVVVMKTSIQRILILIGIIMPIGFFIFATLLWFRRKWSSK